MKLGVGLSITRAGLPPTNPVALGQAALARANAILAAPNTGVTVGTPVAETTASSIPSAFRSWAWVSGRLNNLQAEQGIAQQSGPNPWATSLKTIVTYAPGSETGVNLAYSATYTGTRIDVILKNSGDNPYSVHDIYVDGQFVRTILFSDFVAASVAAGYFLRVPLALNAGTKEIRVVPRSMADFPGFDIEPSETLAETAPASKRVMIVGDSWVEGATDYPDRNFVDWQYLMLGSRNVWKCGAGSTGYVTAGTRTALKDRYANDIIAQAPDVLLVTMGLNDEAAYESDAAGFRASVGSMYDAIVSALPGCKILVFGPLSPTGFAYASSTRIALDSDLNAIAQARGLSFVSPLREDWITGNGKDSAPTGNGNSDQYISSDGTHPNAAGHKYYGWRIAGVLRARGLA